jgi:arylsulfatase A-like enzyme
MNRRPNVIVFFTDQQRWNSTGAHGNPLELTPHFDQMAARGTHLFHTFTCQPVCGPARAVLQTGKYATTVGCWRKGIALLATEQTLAHHFRAAGYREATRDFFAYVESYYNRQRRHSALRYQTPLDFEANVK